MPHIPCIIAIEAQEQRSYRRNLWRCTDVRELAVESMFSELHFDKLYMLRIQGQKGEVRDPNRTLPSILLTFGHLKGMTLMSKSN